MQRSTMSAQTPSDVRNWRPGFESSRNIALAPARFLGFWSAVVLPLVLVPMLLTGYASSHPTAFAALLVVNVIAAVAGRNYDD